MFDDWWSMKTSPAFVFRNEIRFLWRQKRSLFSILLFSISCFMTREFLEYVSLINLLRNLAAYAKSFYQILVFITWSKCKICGEIVAKGYPKLLAHTTSHYSPSELLYNEEAEENILLINSESSKASNQMFEEYNYEYTLRCKICRDSFIFKKKKQQYFLNELII